MFITSETANILINDPRSFNAKKKQTYRNVEEALLVKMLLDPDEVGTFFIVDVPAPGDPELAAFITKYSENIATFLEYEGEIADQTILEYKKQAWNETKKTHSFEEMLSRAERYQDYEAFLLSKRGRRVVSPKQLEKIKGFVGFWGNTMKVLKMKKYLGGDTKSADEYDFEHIMEPFLNNRVGDFKSSETVTYYPTSFKTYHREIPNTHFLVPLDYLQIGKESAKIVNFKILPYTLAEAKEKFLEDFWLEIGCVPLLEEVIQFNTGRKLKFELEYLVMDSLGYEHCYSITTPTKNKCQKRVLDFMKNEYICNMLARENWVKALPVGNKEFHIQL